MNRPCRVAAGVVLALLLTPGCARERAPQPTPVRRVEPTGTSFATRIQPMLVSRCSPCHFPGGNMYEKLPFDRAATIRQLGARMFTRIKDEPDLGTLRAFLDEPQPE